MERGTDSWELFDKKHTKREHAKFDKIFISVIYFVIYIPTTHFPFRSGARPCVRSKSDSVSRPPFFSFLPSETIKKKNHIFHTNNVCRARERIAVVLRCFF